MESSIENIRFLRQKSFDANCKIKKSNWDNYIEELDKTVLQLSFYSNSDEIKKWKEVKVISGEIITFYEDLNRTQKSEVKDTKIGECLIDENEKHRLLDFITINIKCVIKLKLIGQESENVGRHDRITSEDEFVRNVVDRMLLKLKLLNVENEVYYFQYLESIFKYWSVLFNTNIEIQNYLNMRRQWSIMKFKKYKAHHERVFFKDYINFIKNILEYQLSNFIWLVSDFGLSITRFIVSIITIISFFGFSYRFIGELRISALPGFKIHNLLDSFYFSIVTFTTLGFGDLYPGDYFTKILCCIEVVFGYLMLALFINLIIKRLRI